MNPHHPDPARLDLSRVEWTVSSYSGGGGDCVRVGAINGHTLIGDTKDPDRLPNIFTPQAARAFFRGVKSGKFNYHPDQPG
ncbi:DUF397 domain-containing protein [Streptomyces sp. NPDC091377]|uniref:DUF397 domain-containing protein n=1 Tax=Streptomyces sp. NPDC091377 TaxID=3365995 RepID=UPI00380D82F7